MIPNLRSAFGKQYRVTRDPAVDTWHDRWMHIVPTRSGTVFVHSQEFAGVEVGARRWSVLAKLRAAAYRLHQAGDDFETYLVPWADLSEVLPWLRPYKRRQVELTPEQRQELTARMARINASRRAQVQMQTPGQGSLVSERVGQTVV